MKEKLLRSGRFLSRLGYIENSSIKYLRCYAWVRYNDESWLRVELHAYGDLGLMYVNGELVNPGNYTHILVQGDTTKLNFKAILRNLKFFTGRVMRVSVHLLARTRARIDSDYAVRFDG